MKPMLLLHVGKLSGNLRPCNPMLLLWRLTDLNEWQRLKPRKKLKKNWMMPSGQKKVAS